MSNIKVSFKKDLENKCSIFFPKEVIQLEYLCSAVVCLGVLMVLGVDGQAEEGNTVGAIPGQAGRDYPNFQVFSLFL